MWETYKQYFAKGRGWLSHQWETGNKGGAIITLFVFLSLGWWVLKVIWPYLLFLVLLAVALRFYKRYINGPPISPPTKPLKVVTMPSQFSSTKTQPISPKPPISMKLPLRLVSIIIGLIFAGIILTRFLVVVPAGAAGVYELFGKVSPNEISSGLHFVNPLGVVHKMTIRTEQYTMSLASEEGQHQGDDSIDALTKEGLQLKLDMTVLYNLTPSKAADVYLQLGPDFAEKVIRPEIRSSIREIAAQYDANAVYSEKRIEMTAKINDSLKKSLAPRGINVEDVLLRNVILPPKLSDSIQEKLQADQEQQRYDFVLQKETKEAERKRIEAAGQRDAQKIITDGLTPNYLNYLYIQNLKDNKGTIYVPTNPTTGLPLFKGVGQ